MCIICIVCNWNTFIHLTIAWIVWVNQSTVRTRWISAANVWAYTGRVLNLFTRRSLICSISQVLYWVQRLFLTLGSRIIFGVSCIQSIIRLIMLMLSGIRTIWQIVWCIILCTQIVICHISFRNCIVHGNCCIWSLFRCVTILC